MQEGNLKYLKKSDFGGTRSRRGKRKPNQLFVYHTAIHWFDFPKGPHFNKLPVKLILEIFKYLWVFELLGNVSLVCKYWYNLCRDRALWTSITWNGDQRTLGHLLQLTKYQVHELVLTDNLFTFSDEALAHLLQKCTRLKYLKLPQYACRELFQRELPKTNIIIGRMKFVLRSFKHFILYTFIFYIRQDKICACKHSSIQLLHFHHVDVKWF
ncbi:hypothetical protein ACJMK2_009825 [Sinanodonta woodiana]|uniref:F-box domain-containing protein n=1 Tax=Sinanodonta woodiana TaxID=1069815 RepID=A0ABD3VDF3_SINWO